MSASETIVGPPLNESCPWSGKPVSRDALTQYRGRTVGFCNSECRDKFEIAATTFDDMIAEVEARSTIAALSRLAHYNAWMNQRLLDSMTQLTQAQLWEDRGAFFKSVMGTMNHVLVWDITWLQRFERQYSTPVLAPVSKLASPASHDQVLYRDLDRFGVARNHLDGILVAFTAKIDTALLARTLEYTIADGTVFRKEAGAILQHVFNHQTHHRGQITALLFQLGIDPGVTDLLAILPDVTAP